MPRKGGQPNEDFMMTIRSGFDDAISEKQVCFAVMWWCSSSSVLCCVLPEPRCPTAVRHWLKAVLDSTRLLIQYLCITYLLQVLEHRYVADLVTQTHQVPKAPDDQSLLACRGSRFVQDNQLTTY